MKKIIRAVSIVVFIIVILLLSLSILNYTTLQSKISREIYVYGLFGLLILSGLLEFLPQIFSPEFPLTAILILGTNPFLAIGTTIIGSAIGSIIGFEIGRKYGKEIVQNFIEKNKEKKLVNLINKKGKWVVLAAAVSPIPYIPLIIGTLDLTRRNFINYGLIPRAVGFIFKGALIYYLIP